MRWISKIRLRVRWLIQRSRVDRELGEELQYHLHEHKLDSAEPLNVHPVNFLEWQSRARSFAAIALVQTPPVNVMGRDGAEQVSRMLTTPELLHVFGVRPAFGRWFTEDETRPNG